MDSAKKSGHPLLMEKAGLCVNFVPLALKFWEVESSFIQSGHMYLLYIQCVMRKPVHNVLQERNNTNGKENIPHLTWWKVYLGWQVLHTRLQCQNWGKTLFPSKCVCFFPVNTFSYKINTKIPNCIYLFFNRNVPRQSELNAQRRLTKNKEKMESTRRLPMRDLAAKYFGQHLEGEMYHLKIGQ